MVSISTPSSYTKLTSLDEDCFGILIQYIDILGILILLQTNRVFKRHVEKCNRKNKPIIPLKSLPLNLKLFENICYFKIEYKGGVDDVPAKENENHLIDFHCTDKSITDVSNFRNVHILHLNFCRGITDVSALGKVHTLDLYGTYVTDVSALGNVNTLNIDGCTGITDVSALGNVHTLDLASCTGITDVSALGNVHTLDLSICTGITDVSALGNVNYLEILGCTGFHYYNRWIT